MSARKTRLLVLATGEAIDEVRRAHGGFDVLFARGVGADREVVYEDITGRAADAPAPDARAFDGVIMTGSAAMVGEDAPWMRYGARVIREIVDEGVPFLGVCFGHQLLGVALGADVGPNPRGRVYGSAEVALTTDDPVFRDHPRRFFAQVAHRDIIRDPGPRLEVIGRAPHDACHVVRSGPRTWGVQFHPEFDRAVSGAYVEARAGALVRDNGPEGPAIARASLRETLDATRVLARFAALCEALA